MRARVQRTSPKSSRMNNPTTDEARLLALAGEVGKALLVADAAQAERDRLVTELHKATVIYASAKDAARSAESRLSNACRALTKGTKP